MPLKRSYQTEEEIPEAIREHYTEQDGAFVLDVEGGSKTEQDVARLNKALAKERTEHRGTKAKLAAFGDVTPDAIQDLRDQAEDLKLQLETGGKPDEKQLEVLVERRAEAKLRPIQRDLKTAQEEAGRLKTENGELKATASSRRRIDAVHAATRGEKAVKLRSSSVLDDVELLAERHLVEDDAGAIVTREGLAGIPAGLPAADWLREIQQGGTRSHWFAETEGAGADGGTRRGSGGGGGPDIFTPAANGKRAEVNMTEFGKLVTSDPKRARTLAQKHGRADLLAMVPAA